MSRSGYSDDLDGAELNRWRNAVEAAIAGKRGQAMLRDMLEALDAMPVKELIQGELVDDDGRFCALGALGAKRGIDMTSFDGYDSDDLGRAFKIARELAAEVAFQNDECGPSTWFYEDNVRKTREPERPAECWVRMRKWVADRVKA